MPNSPTTSCDYDLFISCASADNKPDAAGGKGWASQLRDQILADQAKFTSHQPSIFFQEEEVASLDEWLQRIQGPLRRSRLLLVCLSSHYFASHHCRWEWEEYVRNRFHHRVEPGERPLIYFVELPDAPEQEIAHWVAEMGRLNCGADLQPWFDEGVHALQEIEVERRLLSLKPEIGNGNLKPTTQHFVGRCSELRQLREAMWFQNDNSRITSIRGLRGLGKTELAIAFANVCATDFAGGRWLLRAEGQSEMVALVSSLGPDLGHLQGEKTEMEYFRTVVDELRDRACAESDNSEAPETCLLILDNVTDPGLVSPDQLAHLPNEPWLKIILTTRLEPKELGVAGPSIELGMLTSEQALDMIRRHQEGGTFETPGQEAAAREIVKELGGFTLAVEAVALFLGLNPQVKPTEYLVRYRESGVKSLDPAITMDLEEVDNGEMQMRKQLATVMGPTLEVLSPPARTAARYAAHFAPDCVPWPWVKELVFKQHPELCEQPEQIWEGLRKKLEKLHLLNVSGVEQIGRMHRLVSNYLRSKDETLAPAELLEFVSSRGFKLAKQASPPPRWEMQALTASLEHLLCRDEIESRYQRELSASASAVVGLVITYRGLGPAADLLGVTIPVVERLVHSDPAKALWRHDLSVCREKLGDVLFSKGSLDPALKAYCDSLQLRERLVDVDPQDPDLQRDLSVTHNKIGDVLRAQGALDDALSEYRAALLIREALVRLEPRSVDRNRDLSVSHERIGDSYRAKGDTSRALRSYRDSLAIRAQLVEYDESNVLWQRDLSVSCEKVGNMLRAQGRPDEAMSAYRQSLAIRQRLAGLEPDNVVWQHDLSISHNKIGDALRAQGKLDEALAAYRESLALAERLVSSARDNQLWQRDLSVSQNKMGDVLVALGQGEEALAAYMTALELRQRFADTERNNPSWQRDLSVCHSKVGDALRSLGRLGQALKAYSDALQIVERLVQLNPNNPDWQRDLWVLCWRIADISEKVGGAEAGQWWQRAYKTLSDMQARNLYVSREDLSVFALLAERVGVTA